MNNNANASNGQGSSDDSGSCSIPILPTSSNGLYATLEDIKNIEAKINTMFLSFLDKSDYYNNNVTMTSTV